MEVDGRAGKGWEREERVVDEKGGWNRGQPKRKEGEQGKRRGISRIRLFKGFANMTLRALEYPCQIHQIFPV